jgi:hypothetical protein
MRLFKYYLGYFMKSIFLLCLVLCNVESSLAKEYTGSKALDVWSTVKNDPYKNLPTNKVSYKDLFDGAISLIERSANRTLNDRSDLLPRFNKLAHPNGVCLKGSWKVTEKNPYSGLFKVGSEAIIIARASVALTKTETGDLRGFGLAGKLFPTSDENEVVETANFFLIDDLGGTKAEHYTDVEMTNEPKVTKTFAVLANLKYALKLATTFKKVDENPSKRQVYEIAMAARSPDEAIATPKWMMVKASSKQLKVDESDFRNELLISVNRSVLSFDVYTANAEVNGKKNWKKIGKINFEESIASDSCDHRLHFHHPKWISELEK